MEKILNNFKYVVLDQKNNHFHFLKDEEELKRWVSDGSLKDGDVVIELTKENLKVAELKNYIELK